MMGSPIPRSCGSWLLLALLAYVSCAWLVACSHAPWSAGQTLTGQQRASVDAAIVELEAWRGRSFRRPVDVSFEELSGVAGYYDSREDVLVVDVRRDGAFGRGLLLHELAHALEDQLFDLAALHEARRDDPEGANALRAVIEGEAMLVLYDLMGYDVRTHTPNDAAPFSTTAVYGTGLTFLLAVREAFGESTVDRVFENLPRTEREVLEPATYLARVSP